MEKLHSVIDLAKAKGTTPQNVYMLIYKKSIVPVVTSPEYRFSESERDKFLKLRRGKKYSNGHTK